MARALEVGQCLLPGLDGEQERQVEAQARVVRHKVALAPQNREKLPRRGGKGRVVADHPLERPALGADRLVHLAPLISAEEEAVALRCKGRAARG